MSASNTRDERDQNGAPRTIRLIVIVTLIILSMFLLCVPGRTGLHTVDDPAPTAAE